MIEPYLHIFVENFLKEGKSFKCFKTLELLKRCLRLKGSHMLGSEYASLRHTSVSLTRHFVRALLCLKGHSFLAHFAKKIRCAKKASLRQEKLKKVQEFFFLAH